MRPSGSHWKQAEHRGAKSMAVRALALAGTTALVLAALVFSDLFTSVSAGADDTTCPTTTVGSFTAGPAGAPLASCLLSIGNDTTNGLNPPDAGVAVSVSNLSNMGGLATDGTTVYMLNGASGDVVTTPLSALPTPSATSGASASATGTVHDVDWSGIGGFGSLGNTMLLSLAYSHGCLFVTNADSSESGSQSQGSTPLPDTDTSDVFSTNIHLYCIDTSAWTVSQVSVPSTCPMPLGHYYTTSSLIEFPDGRIGKVSEYMTNAGQYMPQADGGYTSVLRTYTVSGTGSATTISCSDDYVMHDSEDFGNDEHGIATDGTYLYRIEWWQPESPFYDHNFNSWQLSSGSVPDPTYQGFFAMPFSNMHYLTYNPTGHDYLVGYYNGSDFYITPAADPGPGPGNPLTPEFSDTITSTGGGFTVQLTDYDSSFTWSGTATDGGEVTVSDTGLVTVTGLPSGESSTVTITSTKTGIATGSATVTGSSLTATVPGAPGSVTAVAGDGDATVSWDAPTDAGGATIQDYTVTAIDTTDGGRGGQSVTTADGSATTADVTGLADGDTYTFTVVATNSVGTGPASSASSPVTPEAPPPPSTTAPTTSTTTTTVPTTSTTVPSPAATAPPPVPLPANTDSSSLEVSTHTPSEGGQLILTALGFKPGSLVDFWIHSQPLFLGHAYADSNGVATLSVQLEQDLVQLHFVQAVGIGPLGEQRNLAQSITIGVPSTPSDILTSTTAMPGASGKPLADTGADVRAPVAVGAFLLVSGGAILLFFRRRKYQPKH